MTKPPKVKKPTLSSTMLGVFEDCPRCFWMMRNAKISRPRGIYPSLPSGMDEAIKTYYDGFRRKGTLPPEAQYIPELDGAKLFSDMTKMAAMRVWQSGLKVELERYQIIGALDELLVNSDSTHSPWDYKTKGSPTTQEASERYYTRQLDIYDYLLTKNGFPTNGLGYLHYYWPDKVGEEGAVKFTTKIFKLKTSFLRAEALIMKAIVCLLSPIPSASKGCEYCGYWSTISKSADLLVKPGLTSGIQPPLIGDPNGDI